jgi:GNAT superfamily N-acetyltransferase
MFRVAPARADEAEALTALVRGSAAYPGQYRVMVADQKLDAAYLDANVVRVIRGPGGDVWGFYSLLFPGHGAPGEAELDFMFVANDRQGRGIGRALFADMRAVAEERRASRVHIVSHPPAEAFYLAQGAERVGVLAPAGRATWSRPHLVLEPALVGAGAR